MSLLDKVAAIKQRLKLPPDLDIVSALDTACQLMGEEEVAAAAAEEEVAAEEEEAVM